MNHRQFFTDIPEDRLLEGVSTIRSLDFAGPLAEAIKKLGHPDFIAMRLFQAGPAREWRILFRAQWLHDGAIFGAFDPSAFIMLWQNQIKVVCETNLLLSIEPTDHAEPTETTILSDSFQPQGVRLIDNQFEISTLYLRNRPPEKPRTIPAFMR